MPSNLQVVLQQDVDKLGQSGELVRVRPGFARNYLLPRQLAVAATSAAVK
ncbi:MAG: 50S ribosomal protein L9, partial [Polyangiaceae bacterium]